MEEITTTDRTDGFLPRRSTHRRGPVHRRMVTPRLLTMLMSLALVLTSLPLTAVVTIAATQATWTQLSPNPGPPARYGASMAFDSATNQVILFGGRGSNQVLFSDTWAWNGSTWTQLSNGPSARYDASMAFDSATNQVILYGGLSSAGVLNDTWAWDGSTWTQLSNGPSARYAATMAYDPVSSQLILVGGSNGGNYLGETWAWNGTWTKLSNGPTPRISASVAFDPVSGKLILFGGSNGGSLNDTWTLNGSSWTELNVSPSPSPRIGPSMATDLAIGQIILFGGWVSGSVVNDTWAWNGSTWTQLSPSTNPAARQYANMAVDPATKQPMLFGGANENGAAFGDTWRFALVTVKDDQTISFTSTPPTNAVYGDTYTPTATGGGSGNPVTFGASGACSYDSGAKVVTMNATGTCTVTANQPGNTNYNAAPQVQQSFSVGKANQTIFPFTLLDKTYGDGPFDISGSTSATSGLPVSFSSATPSICTVSGSTVTLVGLGICTINADQAGNDNFNAAPRFQQSFNVRPASQSISIDTPAPASAAYGSTFTVAATASSGLPVSYGSSGACSNSGATFTMISGTGSCTVTFSQDGDGTYYPASSITETVTASKLDQSISFTSTAPANAVYGDTYTPAATGGDSGNPVTFSVSGDCSYDGGTGVVTMTGVGSCTVTADQAGNDNYNAATPLHQLFSVGKANQSITFDLGSLPAKTYGDGSFDISSYASATSGLPVSFSSTPASVCTISGSTVTVVNAGTCTIAAVQAGNDNYNAAPIALQSFSVGKAGLSVTANDQSMTYGGTVPTFDATVTGLVNGDTFTSLGGTCSASVGGNPVTSATPAGSYPGAITCSGVDTSNYDINYAAGKLTVNQATLTVTADDQSMVLGGLLPSFTVSYTGFLNGDGPSVVSGLSCGAFDNSGNPITSNAPVGSYVVMCSDASAANYVFSYLSGTLTIQYAAAGTTCLGDPSHEVLQPINEDGSSVFHAGRTVPVKFRVCDANGASIGTPGLVTDFKLIGTSADLSAAVNEDPTSTTPDTAFRWDATNQEWIFNLSTKGLVGGTRYDYRITLNDGTTIDFSFALK